MARGPCSFRKRDVKMALIAAQDAGLDNYRIEVGGGVAIVVPPKSGSATNNDGATAGNNEGNDWDNQ